MSLVGVFTLVAGTVLLVTNVTGASAATQTLTLTSTAAGVTCDNSNPAMPVCSGLAGGDTITLVGKGFTPGSLASDIECNSDPSQPVILFLGNYVPISCTPLKLSDISATGGYNPPPFAVVQGTTGPVLNNPSVYPPGCTINPALGAPPLPGQSGPIPGCTTSGNPATDAANFPCPPTAAQQAAGDDCAIAIGDQAGDRGVGVVLFGTETLPPPTTTTVAGATTTSGAGTTTTAASGTTTTAASGTTTTAASGTTTTVASGTTTTAASGTTTTVASGTTTTAASGTTTTVASSGPVVSSVSPATGSTAGGDSVTITGTGFTGATSVMFGTVAGTNVVVNGDTSITVTSPAGSAGQVDITVVTPSGTSAVVTGDEFTYAASSGTTTTTTTTPSGPATTLTGAYELYCPGTPVGNIALNDAMTTATLSPAAPTAGQSFSITGYQTMVNLPASLATAAAALSPGQPLTGSATTQILASGATPASTPEGPTNFSAPLPTPIPADGVSLSVPTTPATVPGFTATSANITIQEGSSASLSLIVSGAPLALTCTAYPNDTVPTSGITTVTPTAASIAPIIAVAGTGSSTTTTPPAPTTTKAPSTGSGGGGGGGTTPSVSSNQLAFTGAGPGVGVLGVLGGLLILFGLALLVLVDAPRRAFAQLATATASGRRMGASDLRDRLANLNPMGWRKSRNEGVPDTTIEGTPETKVTDTKVAEPMQSAATQPEAGWAGYSSNRSRGMGDRFARVPEVSRELAQTTARHAVRTAQWLLGR
jgi:hypothetical protein